MAKTSPISEIVKPGRRKVDLPDGSGLLIAVVDSFDPAVGLERSLSRISSREFRIMTNILIGIAYPHHP